VQKIGENQNCNICVFVESIEKKIRIVRKTLGSFKKDAIRTKQKNAHRKHILSLVNIKKCTIYATLKFFTATQEGEMANMEEC